jgi:hypothetical protein
MGGHHLIMGTLDDYLTGESLEDTHDERYRQKIARFLVEEKGYAKADISPRNPLDVSAGSRKGRLWVDFLVSVEGRAAMMIKYAPGSLVTRYRSTLAMSRLVAKAQVPVVVVTNGETADILDGFTGKVTASGFVGIPFRSDLASHADRTDFVPVSSDRAEMESRIVYACEIEGSCPCDDTTCRIS